MIEATAPHTRIDNDIILNMADIGVFGFAVYAAIKQHMNHATGACFPSYARIAKITGMNRSTVIEYTKKLIARKLISREWRFKEDGSHTSNQFNFDTEINVGIKGDKECSFPTTVQTSTTAQTRSNLSRPPVVREADRPSPPARPEQSPLNKTNKTKESAKTMPPKEEKTPVTTEKQKNCPHPFAEVVVLSDGITICNHCYDLIKFPDAQAA
jgi:GntR family transcriptional regulator